MNANLPLWSPRVTRLIASLAAVAAMALTAGCGGSGGGSNSSGNTDSGQTGTPASEVGPFTISGVAAIGAPLLGATVTVVDGKGVQQGSTRTNTSDGSYSVTLNNAHIPLPLLIQATGVDMTGIPVTLHSVVQTSTTGATRGTANISPITEAVVAMLLGADPATQFQSASSLASTWTLLSNTTALTCASDLLKTIAKPVITDTKVTDAAKIDFFQDANFTANKKGADAILEGLNIQVGKDRGGYDQLEISSRLKQPSAPEVTVNLSTARTQLALGSTGKVANAITSTLKVTTSATTLLNNVGTLDTLGTTINRALAERNTSGMIMVLPIYSATYGSHNGIAVDALSAQLAQYGSNGWQLSRFQFTGCADNPMPAKGCNLAQISALLSDSTGQAVGVFDNVVKYDASAGWVFQGNGKLSNWAVMPAAWRAWNSTGQSTASGQGVQLAIKPITDTLFASLTLPSGYTVPMLDCQMGNWCLSATATGDLITDSFLQDTLGWYGAQQDSVRGATYQLSAQAILAQEVSTAILPQDVPTGVAATAFPLPDGLSASSPLTCTQIQAGLRVTWSAWAAANPSLRMQSVQSVVTGAAHLPWVQTAPLYPLSDNVTDVPAVASPPASPTACQLWMVAHDKLGRRYISRIVASIP